MRRRKKSSFKTLALAGTAIALLAGAAYQGYIPVPGLKGTTEVAGVQGALPAQPATSQSAAGLPAVDIVVPIVAPDKQAEVVAPVEIVPATKEAAALVQEFGEDLVGADIVLGSIHLAGKLGRADLQEGSLWIERAADAGSPFGLYLRLRLMEDGVIPTDPRIVQEDSQRLEELVSPDSKLRSRVAALTERLTGKPIAEAGASAPQVALPVQTPTPVVESSQAAEESAASVAEIPVVKAPDEPIKVAGPSPSIAEAGDTKAADGLAIGLLTEIGNAKKPGVAGEATEASGGLPKATIDFNAKSEASQAVDAETARVAAEVEAEQKRVAEEKAAAEKIAAEKRAAEEKAAEEKAAAEKFAAAQKAAEEQLAAEKLAAEKAAAEKLAAEKIAAEKLAAEKEAAEKLAIAKAAAQKAAEAKVAAQQKKAAEERLAKEQAAEEVAAKTADTAATDKPKSDLEDRIAKQRREDAEALQQSRNKTAGATAPAAKAPLTEIQSGGKNSLEDFTKMVAEAQAKLSDEETQNTNATKKTGDAEADSAAGSMVNSKGQVLEEIPQPKMGTEVAQQIAMANDDSMETPQAVNINPTGLVLMARGSDPNMLLERVREILKTYPDEMRGVEPEISSVMSQNGQTYVLGFRGFKTERAMKKICGAFGTRKCVPQS